MEHHVLLLSRKGVRGGVLPSVHDGGKRDAGPPILPPRPMEVGGAAVGPRSGRFKNEDPLSGGADGICSGGRRSNFIRLGNETLGGVRGMPGGGVLATVDAGVPGGTAGTAMLTFRTRKLAFLRRADTAEGADCGRELSLLAHAS